MPKERYVAYPAIFDDTENEKDPHQADLRLYYF